ncbi:zinc metallopeptidase [Cerasicoccus fimbriatus]|uniref:zinc metallopeptidase n=1 Tax=Cerasicoccus fimbriatus TaxID=3014554 RepID=UPI0022B48684|nr:zinc metallopeptidase [Cerasicoccus sp. TK19100]
MGLFLLLIVPTMILGFWAQHRVSSAYNQWKRVPTRSRITGREAADAVMRNAGIYDVDIVEVPGHLTDHYDPANKRLALSRENYRGYSLAAVGVAAHEAGHAIQHKVGYKALQARMSLIPLTTIASQALPFVILGGMFFGALGLIKLGVLCYAVLTVFQLVTLPVEFDASKRARVQLAKLGIVGQDEMPGVVKTLNAAGMTYVAAFVSSLANLLYLFALSRD